jgi:hypothetical protein
MTNFSFQSLHEVYIENPRLNTSFAVICDSLESAHDYVENYHNLDHSSKVEVNISRFDRIEKGVLFFKRVEKFYKSYYQDEECNP